MGWYRPSSSTWQHACPAAQDMVQSAVICMGLHMFQPLSCKLGDGSEQEGQTSPCCQSEAML